MKDEVCEVTELGMAFGEHKVFEGVNFDVRRGDLFAAVPILGSNLGRRPKDDLAPES
ncbi:MAG: hypothetical protein GXP35_02305 [Actinobacteria bacterium]|nr:hypothetical protein [Actinomycetota bacterium]